MAVQADVVRLRAAEDLASPPPSGAPTPSADRPEWRYDVQRDATSPATVHLTGFPPEPAPDPRAAFIMRGVTSNNRFTSHPVAFRLADLSGLRSGSVLITTTDTNEEVQKSVSLDEFAPHLKHRST